MKPHGLRNTSCAASANVTNAAGANVMPGRPQKLRYTSRSMNPSASPNGEHGISPRNRVLVTGGAGFIGSAVVWGLNRRGCTDIVIADRASHSDRQQNLRSLQFSAFVPAEELLARLATGSLGKFDYVFHLGACSSTSEKNREY